MLANGVIIPIPMEAPIAGLPPPATLAVAPLQFLVYQLSRLTAHLVERGLVKIHADMTRTLRAIALLNEQLSLNFN